MALGSSEDTVAILYDNENAPFEMLNYALGKARKFLPCRMIVVADWDECPDQKRWKKLMTRQNFTFRQIERTYEGKNSLDNAIADNAVMMAREGVQRFIFITTDADFVELAQKLREINPKVVLMGIGSVMASPVLRKTFDKFEVYRPRKTESVASNSAAKTRSKAVIDVPEDEDDSVKLIKPTRTRKSSDKSGTENNTDDNIITGKKDKIARTKQAARNSAKTAAAEKNLKAKPKTTTRTRKTATGITGSSTVVEADGNLQVHIPKTLHQQLVSRMQNEDVDMNQLVTYLLMNGIAK